MADNYLEYAREDYERRKAAWLRKKSHMPRKAKASTPLRTIEKPDDEAL